MIIAPAVTTYEVEEQGGILSEAKQIGDPRFQEWAASEPEPVEALSPVLNVPVHALPEFERSYLTMLADSLQVPPDAVLVPMLGSIAAALSGKLVVDLRPGWEQNCNLYSVVILPPAAGKSPAFNKVVLPLSIREKQVADEVKRENTRRALELEAIKREESEKKRLGKLSDEELRAFAVRREEVNPLKIPRLRVSDCTPEACARICADQPGNVLACITSEGTLLANIHRYAGRGGGSLDLYLQAFDGETVHVDRAAMDKPPIFLARPLLTLALGAQPALLHAWAQHRDLVGRGLMDRILWAWPDARLGYRSWEAPPFELYQQRRWEDRILALLSCQPTYPARFVLSAPAEVRFGRFYDEIQKRIREDEGDLALVPGWASKLCGITGRLAGLLQAISNLDRNGDPFSCDHISLQAMESSLALSKYFASHCVRVYKNAGFATGSGTAEARLLRLLKRIGSLVDSQGLVRDQAIWQSIKGPSFPSKADLDFLLDGLIKKGHLLLITSRPKLYRLHPSHLNSTQQSALGV